MLDKRSGAPCAIPRAMARGRSSHWRQAAGNFRLLWCDASTVTVEDSPRVSIVGMRLTKPVTDGD